jgi:TolB-like protein/Tfp pilus assembly protein PilF
MQLLVFLSRHPGKVISIEHMIDEVWQGKPMTSGSVYNALNTLRKTFGDSKTRIRYIETLPRRGYRLIAEVQQLDDKDSTFGSGGSTGAAPSRGLNYKYGLAALLPLVIILVWVVQQLNSVPEDLLPETPVADKSIAVMPFINRSQLEQDAYFTGGIHDELLSSLSGISGLKVTSRTSVMHFRNSDLTAPEIAEMLSVAYVLEGGVQRAGDQVRINVQLIDARSDKNIWSETYDRKLTVDSLFAIQSEISAEIAATLDTELTRGTEHQALSLSTSSLAAYDLYLRGRQLIANRNRKDTEAALNAFEQAVEIDPEFAEAWVGVANATMLINFSEMIVTPEGREKHWRAAQSALALDDQLAEAHASLGMYYVQIGERLKARDEFERSIELNANYAQAYHWFSLSYGAGVTQEGASRGNPANTPRQLALLYKASELDPLSSIIQLNIGEVLVNSGRYDEALAVFHRLLEYNPDFILGLTYISRVNWWNGHLAESLKWMQKAQNLNPTSRHLKLLQAAKILSFGDDEAFDEVRAILSDLNDEDYWRIRVIEHNVLFAQGDFEEALSRIESLPEQASSNPWVMESKLLTHVARQQWQQARRVYLQLRSESDNPEQWDTIINTFGRTPGSCLMAGILAGSGEEVLSADLLQKTLHYRELILPTLVEDADFGSDLVICYLISGRYEQALAFMERRVVHGHILDWWQLKQLPWWEPVRDHPRYRNLVQQVEALLSDQRALLGPMEELSVSK